MIVGGAQENTLFNCIDLVRSFGDQVRLVTGLSEGAEGELLSQSDTNGIEIEIQRDLIRSIQPFRDRRAYQCLKASIDRWKPDVVHTHSAKAGLLGRAAAWNQRIKCVVHTVHGAPFHPYQNWASRRFFILCERWAARRCHHMISVANAMTDLLVQSHVASRTKFTTIYSGMAVEPFLESNCHRESMRAKLGFVETDVVFGKIARLFHLKGHSYVIEAAKQVCHTNPNIKFLFVGDGVLREQFQLEIRAAGLANQFRFAGLVKPAEVPFYMGAMDALVHTSLREGLARALPQALIASKPAISFDVDGAREVVLDGETGCLVPAKDVNALVQAIQMLASNGHQRSKMGQRGCELFTEQFRHETMTKKIRSLYWKQMHKGNPNRPGAE